MAIRTSISRIVFFFVLLLLESCSTLPTVKQQDLSIPKTTRSGHKIIDGMQDLRQDLWWEKLHDPVMNRLITEALANNNQIQMAEANILQAQAVLKEAQMAWLPTLSGSGYGFAGRTWDSHFQPIGALAASPTLSKLGAINFKGAFSGFVPSYSLNILANLKRNQYATASLGMHKAVYNATRLSIISQVSGAYFMLLGQKEQLKEQSALIKDLRNLHELELARFNDGASDLSTPTSLEQQITSYQANIATIENTISEIENALQLLINRNPGPIETKRDLYTLSIRGLIPSHLPSAVLKNRPDIIVAEEELKMASANIGLAYSSFFPSISLTGLLGRSSIDLTNLLKLRTGFGLVDAGVAIPLLNGVAYQQINEAKAGYLASYSSYVQTVRNAFSDVNNALTNQQQMDRAYANQLKSYHAAIKAHHLALAKYQAGAQDRRVVANAQFNLDSAKLNLTLAKMQQLDSIVEVYQALAGGYERPIITKNMK